MSSIEITSVSSKGQIVIPNDIRKNLNIDGGSKLIVLQDGDNILLKPIAKPKKDEFAEIIKLGNKIRKELDLSGDDVVKAIKESRKARASRR